MKLYFSISIILATIMSTHSVLAADKAPASKETQGFQRIAIQGTDREMGLGISEFPPNAEKPRHMATGPEVCYVLEGDIVLKVNGKPTQHIHAGGTFQIAANAVHVTKAGPMGAKVIATWVYVPGKQFNIPAPN
jgi:quercetin dioxygenase-like cupin family protein